MGFFKSLGRGAKAVFGGGKSKPSKPASIARSNTANFTPVGDATFTLVSDELPIPNPQTEAEEEAAAQRVLEKAGADDAENAFLGGEVVYFQSSNVSWGQYLWKGDGGHDLNLLYLGFNDGSIYEYSTVTFEEALDLYRASSKGIWTWDNLRVRKTVYGWKKPYRLLTTEKRLWHRAGADSIARHEAIPKSGEPYEGYTPHANYSQAKGAMGAKGGGINLGKKGGSRKVVHFSPSKAKATHIPRAKGA